MVIPRENEISNFAWIMLNFINYWVVNGSEICNWEKVGLQKDCGILVAKSYPLTKGFNLRGKKKKFKSGSIERWAPFSIGVTSLQSNARWRAHVLFLFFFGFFATNLPFFCFPLLSCKTPLSFRAARKIRPSASIPLSHIEMVSIVRN